MEVVKDHHIVGCRFVGFAFADLVDGLQRPLTVTRHGRSCVDARRRYPNHPGATDALANCQQGHKASVA